MQPPTFENAVGALLAIIAVLVISYLAVTATTGDVRSTALGALIAIIAAATGFFLRAKVQAPTSQPPPAVPRSASDIEQTPKRE